MILSQLDFTRPAISRVRFGPSQLEELPEILKTFEVSNTALLADRHVFHMHGERLIEILLRGGIEPSMLELPRGELAKSRSVVDELQDRMLERGFDRRSLILGFGGGVTLDVAGYIAATFLRGVPWISLPTSLLAQVDAGIGGKTGINVPSGKNLIGVFHPPLDVIIDPDLLATLDPLHLRNGMAEVVKHGWIADRELFEELETDRPVPLPPTPELLQKAVTVKCSVVAEDPFEAGFRAILNAGHTIAHAVEAASGHTILHGYAVAIGLAVEADVAHELTGLSGEDRDRLVSLLKRLELLPDTSDLEFNALLPFLKTDKKNVAGAVRLALPKAIGAMAGEGELWTHEVSFELLEQAWENRP